MRQCPAWECGPLGKFSLPPLDFDLSDDIAVLRDALRSFADAEIVPIAAEIDRNNSIPRHLWSQLGELGLLRLTVPEEDGSTGLVTSVASKDVAPKGGDP